MPSVERHEEVEKSKNEGSVTINGCEYSIESLTSSIGFLFRASYLQIRELLRATDQFNLKPAMFELLRITGENPDIRQAHAARILLIQESNMANLVREAAKQQLIDRIDTNGRRRQGLWLTARGQEVVAEITKLATAIEQQHTELLASAEDQHLRSLLARIYKAGLLRRLAADSPESSKIGGNSED